jgi:hypothetical protein
MIMGIDEAAGFMLVPDASSIKDMPAGFILLIDCGAALARKVMKIPRTGTKNIV